MDRPPKRSRLGSTAQAQPTSSPPIFGLAATTWAAISDFLLTRDIGSLLQLSKLTSRFFLSEVLKEIQTISVDVVEHLDVPTARTCEAVIHVNIFCLVEPNEGMAPRLKKVHSETVSRTCPFLQSFPKLRSCRIGGIGEESGDFIPYTTSSDIGTLPEGLLEDELHFRTFVGIMCGAFASRALPQNIDLRESFSGYRCQSTLPQAILRRVPGIGRCNLCRKICDSFPFDFSYPFDGDWPSHRCCLSWRERLECIQRRPGGREYLRLGERLIGILDCGRYTKPEDKIAKRKQKEELLQLGWTSSQQNGPVRIDENNYDILFLQPRYIKRLKILIDEFGFDPSGLTEREILRGLDDRMGLCPALDIHSLPLSERPGIAKGTLDFLKSVGFNLNGSSFREVFDETRQTLPNKNLEEVRCLYNPYPILLRDYFQEVFSHDSDDEESDSEDNSDEDI